ATSKSKAEQVKETTIRIVRPRSCPCHSNPHRQYLSPTRLGSPRTRTWLNCPDVFGPSRWAQIYTPSPRTLLQDAPSDGRLQGTESRLTSHLCKSVRINSRRSEIDKRTQARKTLLLLHCFQSSVPRMTAANSLVIT
ncbi:uncharacterized protein CCOS01_03904, partial [Colletotrichum costaricense]